MKVLVSAFSCAPHAGSEPGVGWNVVSHASRRHAVWVLTECRNRPSIEGELVRAAKPNVRFVFVDLPLGLNGLASASHYGYLHYLIWQLRAFSIARALHRKIGFDLVHHVTYGNSWMPSWMGWLGIPFVWSAGVRDKTPSWFYRDISWAGRGLELARDFAMTVVGSFTHLSTAVRARLILSSSDKRMWRDELPVMEFPLGALEPEEAQLLHRIPQRRQPPFRVASVGRLLPRKGFAFGIRAFARFRREQLPSEYWIIGEGPERASLEKLARRLSCGQAVRFLGKCKRPELFDHLSSIDVLLHPSIHEQFGYVVLEAMHAGRPVICLDTGGPGHLVSPDAGVVIPPSSQERVTEEIHGALLQMALHPETRIQMGLRARQRASDQWEWERVAERLLNLYENAAATRPRRGWRG